MLRSALKWNQMKQLDKRFLILIVAFFMTAVMGCQNYTPKPHGYPKIEFPEKTYKRFDDGCSYTFNIPTYAIVEKDTHLTSEPCWFNIKFPSFGATIYLTYKQLLNDKQIDSLSDEAFKMAGEHRKKADAIDEKEIYIKRTDSHGVIFELKGPSATPFNFYLSDEKNHYVRGSFYFDNHTNIDSVAPVYAFLKEDMMNMINSLEWAD
ncbi:MAG: gliding motility-associated lipoprotein GldD [Bacteroidia bacterium]